MGRLGSCSCCFGFGVGVEKEARERELVTTTMMICEYEAVRGACGGGDDLDLDCTRALSGLLLFASVLLGYYEKALGNWGTLRQLG